MPIMEFNYPKVKRLRKRYEEAVEKKEETFKFEGNEILTDYAKYMLEHLENQYRQDTTG